MIRDELNIEPFYRKVAIKVVWVLRLPEDIIMLKILGSIPERSPMNPPRQLGETTSQAVGGEVGPAMDGYR